MLSSLEDDHLSEKTGLFVNFMIPNPSMGGLKRLCLQVLLQRAPLVRGGHDALPLNAYSGTHRYVWRRLCIGHGMTKLFWRPCHDPLPPIPLG
jgi:hypothetical protein